MMKLNMTGTQFVQGLAAHDVQTIMDAATARRMSPHKIIYEQGTSATEFYLLTKGHARYFTVTPDGRRILLHWLSEGDVLGVAAMLQSDSKYRVGAETVQECSLLVWQRQALLSLADRYPRVLHNLLSVGVGYLDLYIAAHSALVSETARERLGNVLSRLAPSIGREVADGIELKVTNEELASAANITPFTASRIVSEWQARNVITKRRGKIVLHVPERLFQNVS
jgi:CRP-like cAMP-binding protein